MGFRAPLLAVLIVLPLVSGACGDKKAAPATDATGATTEAPATGPTTTTEPQTTTVAVTPPPSGSAGAKAVAAYKAYLAKQAAILVQQTTAFERALRRGDPETAVKTYPKVRAAYERVQRIAVRLNLDIPMDAQEGTVPAASWSGFHQIEKTIFESGMTSGTEQPGARLLVDANAVRAAVQTLELDPEIILGDANALLQRISDTTSKPAEEPYSLANLYAISGNLRSAEAAWKAVRPLAAANDSALASEVDAAFETAVTTVESFRTSRGLRGYDELGENEKAAIFNAVTVARDKLTSVQL